MRIWLRGDDPLERLAIRLNLAPLPVGLSFFGMPSARVLALAQKLGVLGQLARAPASVEEVAAAARIRPQGARMLLEALTGMGVARQRGDRFELARRVRRWLDPDSPRYIGTFLAHTYEYWEWWGGLEGMLRDGRGYEIHSAPDDDPSWPVYIRGQYELARLSAGDVARALKLPSQPRSVLDVAGGHGWFAAALCARHEGMVATVIDLPPSAAVGRQIIAENRLSERVRHVDGDMFEADLGGPHDVALCFDIIHHLSPEQIVALFGRVRAALRPGGTLAVLDMFHRPGERPRASASFFRLFFSLTSGADIYAADQLAEFLGQSGFGPPRRRRIRSIPDQSLFQATVR
jgi:ubiquinone/menaquinone biosynthesis C-methylase UbiE